MFRTGEQNQKKNDNKTNATIFDRAENNEATELDGALCFKDAAFLWQKVTECQHKGATIVKYDNLLFKHILPVLGDCRLSEINTDTIADFMNGKLNSGRLDNNGGLSRTYVRSMMVIVLNIINFAIDEGMCTPIKIKVRKPPIEKKELTTLSIYEQQNFEKYLFSNINETNIGILISLYNGLRISEVCALKWSDIDFGNSILHVRSTVARVKTADNNFSTQLIIDKPKTNSSLRDIPISKKLMNALTKLYDKRKSEYVVSDKHDFISPRTYEYRFHKALEKGGIQKINYHILRHTFATRCIELGVDVKTLSEILGHSDVSVTLNTYVHSSIERKREELEKLSMLYE